MGRKLLRPSVGTGRPIDREDADPESTALLLVRRIQEGGPYATTAFRELVERYTDLLFRRAYRLVGSVEDAEEVVQEVFLRAFRSIRRFRPEQPLEHWLLTITTNSARNLLRTRFREARKRSEYGDFLRVSARVTAARGAHDRAALEQAMETLDPTTRMAISLQFFEGQTYREVSEALGLGESAVKMRVHRGIEHLRRQLSEDIRWQPKTEKRSSGSKRREASSAH